MKVPAPERSVPLEITLETIAEAPLERLAPIAQDLAAQQAALAALQTAIAARLTAAPPPKANPNGVEPLLTTAEAASLLSVPTGYVGELGRRGELPRVRLGKYVRFRPADVRAWIERHRDDFA